MIGDSRGFSWRITALYFDSSLHMEDLELSLERVPKSVKGKVQV